MSKTAAVRTLFIASLALVAGCSSLGIIKSGGERIRAEGTAAYNPADHEGSRKAALLAAQRNAVEQVLGVFVSAQTRVSKAEIIESKIVSSSAGFIKQYSVESEKREGDTYRVSIRAVVMLDRIDRDLSALNLESSAPLAAVLVASAEEAGGVSIGGRDAARSVEQALGKKGFKILPYDEAVKTQTQALAAARAAGADYVVFVEAKAYRLDNAGSLGDGFFPWRARASVRASVVQDGSAVGESARESGGLDVAEPVAARKALAGAGELAAQDITADLELAAKSRTKSAELLVAGLSGLEQLRDFRRVVSGLAAVDECRLKSYEGGDAVFFPPSRVGRGR